MDLGGVRCVVHGLCPYEFDDLQLCVIIIRKSTYCATNIADLEVFLGVLRYLVLYTAQALVGLISACNCSTLTTR